MEGANIIDLTATLIYDVMCCTPGGGPISLQLAVFI